MPSRKFAGLLEGITESDEVIVQLQEYQMQLRDDEVLVVSWIADDRRPGIRPRQVGESFGGASDQ